MFKPVSPKLNVNEMEEAVLKFWNDEEIFRKSTENRKGGREYIFFEGFPVSPWLFLAITGGSLLLFAIFADKEYKPKTTPGWMWFVAVSLMVTSLGAFLLWVFFGKPLDIPNSNNDDVWVPPSE